MAKLKERKSENNLLNSFAGAVAIYGGAVSVAADDEKENRDNHYSSFAHEAEPEDMVDRAYLVAIYGGWQLGRDR